MLKLYRKEQDGSLSYAEYWIDHDEAIIHCGKVGYQGHTERIEDYLSKFAGEEEFKAGFIKRFLPQGFNEITQQDTYWILVQYPLKSLQGSKRDLWLKDRATDVLNVELGWKGLGHVDGFDMGRTSNPDKQFALNIFCIVVDEEKSIAVIKSALRKYGCDYTKIKIASRPASDNTIYTLKYSAKKNDFRFFI